MAEVVQGTSSAPGLPPIDLPTLSGQSAPLRIEITKTGSQQAPTFGDLSQPWSPPQSAAPTAQGPTFGDLSQPWTPPEPKAPPREVSGTEAGLRGLGAGLSFEFEPAVVGGYQAAKTALGYGEPGQTAGQAHDTARQSELEENARALQQHPYLFRGGELGGAIATGLVPGFGAARAATTLGRIAASAGAGTVGGALTGAGQATSEGQSAADVAKSAGLGAAVGGALGGGASGVLEAAGGLGGKVVSALRGARDVDAEASRRVVNTLRQDFTSEGPQFTPGQARLMRRSGTPTAIVDFGGERTLATARSAANTSPEARRALQGLADRRFEQQSERIGNFIGNLTGGQRLDTEALQAVARRANAPAYKRGYAMGDRRFPRGVWSPKLEELLSSDAVPAAMQRAASKGRDRAVAEGLAGFNPN